MPKPAFIDRNGWESVTLSQHPVYQVTHWQSPNCIHDLAEVTKPSLFLAQEKLFYMYVSENGLCGQATGSPCSEAPLWYHFVLVFVPSWEGSVVEMISGDSRDPWYHGHSPALHWSPQWTCPKTNGLQPQKAHLVRNTPAWAGEVRPAQSLCCWGWVFWGAILSRRRLMESIALLSSRTIIREIAGDGTD